MAYNCSTFDVSLDCSLLADSDACFTCTYDQICKQWRGYYDFEPTKKIYTRTTNVVSCFFLMVAGFFILNHSKFKKHPYPFIGIACLAESFFYFLNGIFDTACLLPLPSILGYSISWAPLTPAYRFKMLQYLLRFSKL